MCNLIQINKNNPENKLKKVQKVFTDFRDLQGEIESKIDITNVLDYLGFKKGPKDGYFCILPGHEDKASSFIASPGSQVWTCLGTCQASGNLYNIMERFKDISYKQAVLELAELAGIPKNSIQFEKNRLEIIAEKLQPLSLTHKKYLNSRGIKVATAEQFNLRSHNNDICFPQVKENEIACYKFINPVTKKMYVEGIEQKAKLYPHDDLSGVKDLFICAGEYDTMYLQQKLIEGCLNDCKAYSNSNGEGNIPKNIITAINEAKSVEKIHIFYDNDKPGKSGANKLADFLSVLNLPVYVYFFQEDKKDGYDISDFFNDGYTLSELLELKRELYDTRKKDIISIGDVYEIQRVILCALVLDNSLINEIVERCIEVKHFSDFRFQEIYKKIILTYQELTYVSFDLLKNRIKDKLLSEAVEELLGAYIISSQEEFLDYLEKIKLNYCRNEVQRLKPKLDLLLKKEMSRNDLILEMNSLLNSVLIENAEDKRTKTLTEILNDYNSSINDREELRFVSTPLNSLNAELQDGFRVGKVTLLGALPSTGKTAITRQFADYAARNGIETAVYILETEHHEIAEMTLADRNNTNNIVFKRRDFKTYLDPHEMISYSIKDYDSKVRYIEAFDMTGSQIIEDIRIKKRKHNVKFVIVDLLHALDVEKPFMDMKSYIGSLMSRFVQLALIEQIALVINCHFTRPQKGSSIIIKKPTLESFAETSNLEKRAYAALALYEDNGVMMLGILKNRGNRKDVHLPIKFIPEFSRFEDYKDYYEGVKNGAY